MLDDGDDEEDGDTPAVLTGSESILDICQQLFHPVRTLRWHYRSQHQSLIAFSNHHFYNGKLMVFPSPFDRNNRLGLRYRYIKNGAYRDRQNVPEALRVVDAVIEHMIKHPEESLGVVTLNQTQRDLIEDLLDKKLHNIEEAQTFISKWEEESWPFFVKNLENVQGDERDVIFISTTFGKAPGTDKPRQNFGPISRPNGWRRLNVLFTRARRKIDLFTSMLPEDIVLDAKTPESTRALRDYLDFAKSGILTSPTFSGREPDSDFEIAVGDMLRNRGYEVVPQLGVAGFFIDLAVRNPDRPGEFLAAVECDGATYHSSHSARDRDRIRQTILESLGWKDRIWRIWSTDWFYDPRRESERLFSFLEERRAASRSESLLDYDIEDVSEAMEYAEQKTTADVTDAAIDPTLSISDEDLYVEVGDRVTYCFIDKPEERLSIKIVDTESKPQFNLINESAPLAQTLLNSAVGDEPELEVKGSPTRVIRVLRIHRSNDQAFNSADNSLQRTRQSEPLST
jgi:transcription elongation GreA/GreB family factor